MVGSGKGDGDRVAERGVGQHFVRIFAQSGAGGLSSQPHIHIARTSFLLPSEICPSV